MVELPLPKDKNVWLNKKDYILKNICTDELSRQIYNAYNDAININSFAHDEISVCASTETHYLISDVLQSLCKNPVVVDCGAYIGDLAHEMNQKNIQYKTIYAFEASYDNFLRINNYIADGTIKNIIPYNYAVWDTDTELKFMIDQNMDTDNRISEDGQITVEAKALDNIIATNIDFLKMDIEGAELPALKGAKKLLATSRPVLAISIYHSMDDLVDIPLYLDKLLDNYQFIVRHHSWMFAETVLYGFPHEKFMGNMSASAKGKC